MGDGKTFEQALRALDKLIAEQSPAVETHRAVVDLSCDRPERIVAVTPAPSR